jgi:type IV secretion system protein VirD4
MPAHRDDGDGLILGYRSTTRAKRSMGFVGTSSEGAPADSLFRYSGVGHLMSFGPTGSSKTTGPVICNALTHPGQLVSIECKGDVHEATWRQRQRMGQKVVLLDARDENEASGGFNPFDAYERMGGDHGVIARTMAAALITRGTRDEEFWLNWAETNLTAHIALILDTHEHGQRTLARLFDQLHADDVDLEIARQLDTHKARLSRAAYRGLAAYLQLPERETRPSVLGSTQQHVRLWDSDLVRRLTERTTFDLAALIDGQPMSLYIVVSPARLEALAPLLRMWLGGLTGALMTRRRRPEHRTLLLCDEIGALGRFDAFVGASTLLRSASVQLWTFWQNPAQLEIYGSHARTLVDNAGVLQLLGARNLRMATEFSALTGGLDAQEILAMGDDECLALVEGRQVERLRRIRYFEHPVLRELVPPDAQRL